MSYRGRLVNFLRRQIIDIRQGGLPVLFRKLCAIPLILLAIPVVYSIVNFLAFRALEQIRNDVILQELNVKFIATGVNDYFRFLGPSHCCGDDDVKIMELIHMQVYDPYTETRPFQEIVNKWISDEEAGYIRV